MDIQGYATIKRDAKTGVGPNIQTFLGQDVRVMEFASDGGVLVVNREATAAAMFDKEDVYRSFKCTVSGDVICPPGINLVEQMLYMGKVMQRKGGYNPLLKAMVIQASLAKGQFHDSFLWQCQDGEPSATYR